jgi:hypothetical protein
LAHVEEHEPAAHRIGRKTYLVADVAPLDVDGIRTLIVGTALWGVAFVALLPFYGRLDEQGRAWWLWTCLAGFGLGLMGLEVCRRRAQRDAG